MKRLYGQLVILFLLCFATVNGWSSVALEHDYPLKFHVDWDEFITLNGSKVVPVGQKVIVPVIFTEASEWRGSTIKLGVIGSTTQLDRDNVADFGEGIVLSEVQPEPFKVLLPVTVKGEGEFALSLVLYSSQFNLTFITDRVFTSVFSFEGLAAFDNSEWLYHSSIKDETSFPQDEIVRLKFKGEALSKERLIEEREKLYQRYLAKYPKYPRFSSGQNKERAEMLYKDFMRNSELSEEEMKKDFETSYQRHLEEKEKFGE